MMALLSLLTVASLQSGVVWKVLLALPNGTHVPQPLPPLLPPLCEDCVPLWGPGACSAPCDEVRCQRCPAPPCDHPALPRCQGPALLLWRRPAEDSDNRLQEGASLWRRLWSSAQQQSWHVLRAMSRPPPQLPPGGPPQRVRSRFKQLLTETKDSVIEELRNLQRWIRGGRRDGDQSDHE